MKSPLAALSALAAATLALTGCGATQSSSSSTASAANSQAASGKVEVFAAASLNNAGADLEKAYEAANPGVDLTALVQGQRLCIPPAGSRGSCADGAAAQELGADTTAAALAQQLGISLQSLMMANPTFTPTDFLKGRLVCVPVRA